MAWGVLPVRFLVIPGRAVSANPESGDYKLEIPGSHLTMRPEMTRASWFVIAGWSNQ